MGLYGLQDFRTKPKFFSVYLTSNFTSFLR